MMSQGVYSILLLIVSNVFMTFAWYGHLKLQDAKLIDNWPLILVILFMGIALFEYCAGACQQDGFPRQWRSFHAEQLKVIQEVITLVVFTLFSTLLFKGESLHWNHRLHFCV